MQEAIIGDSFENIDGKVKYDSESDAFYWVGGDVIGMSRDMVDMKLVSSGGAIVIGPFKAKLIGQCEDFKSVLLFKKHT